MHVHFICCLFVVLNPDMPCLVILHVIGGTGRLPEVVKSVGVKDKRLVFTSDGFDAEGVTTKCYDSPPKGRIAKPVAHLQSIRFLRLGSLLQKLKLPVFVSDIDLLLQRGVKDLLQRCAHADVVFNENTASKNAGSRQTANLLLVNPTENAALFLRFHAERQYRKQRDEPDAKISGDGNGGWAMNRSRHWLSVVEELESVVSATRKKKKS